MLSELIDQWCGALESEIQAVRKSGGASSRIEVTHGRLVGGADGRYLYEFEAEHAINLPDDSQVEIKIGGQTYSGTVVACAQYLITLAMDANVGNDMGRATITSDLTFLLQRLADEWRRVRDGEVSLNAEAVIKLLATTSGNCARVSPSPLSSPPAFPPNIAQREAVAASLGNETTFIWGPPGTGKTRTLAWVAEAFLSRGMTVLVCAHTNVATDQAILAIQRILSKSLDLTCREHIEQGRVLRFGMPQLEEVCPACKTPGSDAEHSPVCVQGVINQMGAEVSREIDAAEAEMRRVTHIVAEKQEYVDFWARYDEVRVTTGRASEQITTLAAQWDGLVVRLETLQSELERLSNQLVAAEQSGPLRRLLRGLNPEKLRNERDKIERDLHAAGETHGSLSAQLGETGRLHEEAVAQSEAMEPRAHDLRVRGEDGRTLQAALLGYRDALSELERRASALRARLQSIENEVVKGARLIACTLTKSFLNANVSGRRFDAVIVDEASMAPVPAICYAAGLSVSRLVIVGDFRQLAPIAVGDTVDNAGAELVREWLRRDVFDHAGVINKADRQALIEDPRIAALYEQYRMHAGIARVCNDVIYEGQLRTVPSKAYVGLDAEPFPNRPLVLVDTSSVNPWCAHDPSKSRYNLYSAVVAVELARQALESDLTDNLTVGITCAYKAQANLIRRLVKSKGLSRDRVEVANVHRYQGNERDVMIYDTVDGPRLGVGLPQRDHGGTDARRLINVAITRPKSKLIIIANHHYVAGHLRGEDTLRRVLGMAADAFVEGSTEVIQSYFHPDVAAAFDMLRPQPIDIPLDRTLFVTDYEFWGLFLDDLRTAARRVVVFSPFTTQNRIDKLVDPLRMAVSRGVAVYVVTRRPTGQMNLFGEDPVTLHAQLREAGVEIIHYSPRMHEKIAIVDDKIAWLGSLNILAHGAGTEMMMRVPDEAVVAEIKRLWDIDRLIRDADLAPLRNQNHSALSAIVEGQFICDLGHILVLKINGQTHEPFMACPVCARVTKPIHRTMLTGFIAGLGLTCNSENCTQCGYAPCRGQLAVRTGRGGRVFLGCNHHPECNEARSLRDVF